MFNNDKWLLQNVSCPNLVQSQHFFAAGKIWNFLPLSLCEIDSVLLFKTCLKFHYFSIAFENAVPLFGLLCCNCYDCCITFVLFIVFAWFILMYLC